MSANSLNRMAAIVLILSAASVLVFNALLIPGLMPAGWVYPGYLAISALLVFALTAVYAYHLRRAGALLHVGATLPGRSLDLAANRPALHAGDGDCRDFSWAEPEPTSGSAQIVPLPTTWAGHLPTKRRLGHRHHLYPPAQRLDVSGGRAGLVQPLRGRLGAGSDARNGVWP